jgi:hypothetical protein
MTVKQSLPMILSVEATSRTRPSNLEYLRLERGTPFSGLCSRIAHDRGFDSHTSMAAEHMAGNRQLLALRKLHVPVTSAYKFKIL